VKNFINNVQRLARLAGVPCPLIVKDGAFVIWQDNGQWGHIDPVAWKVTRWNGQYHERVALAVERK